MLNRSKIVIFIRGTQRKPLCQQSSKVVEVLKENGFKFECIDVTKDYNAEAGIQEYSSLPGIPQIYYKSELVGNFESFMQVYESGKLKESLSWWHDEEIFKRFNVFKIVRIWFGDWSNDCLETESPGSYKFVDLLLSDINVVLWYSPKYKGYVNDWCYQIIRA